MFKEVIRWVESSYQGTEANRYSGEERAKCMHVGTSIIWITRACSTSGFILNFVPPEKLELLVAPARRRGCASAWSGHGPRVSKAKVGLYLRNIAFNAGSLRKCRGGVANLYDGIQFIPVNYSAFSLDFLSFRELARIVPALPVTPPHPSPLPFYHFSVMRAILYM